MKRITLLFLLSISSLFYSVAQEFGGGAGTSADPYILNTSAHFIELSDKVHAGNPHAGKYFAVKSDIDFNNVNFRPIGNNFDGPSNNHFFSGIVDGENHKISNFKCSFISLMGVGIFGLTSSNCVIKNIHLISGAIECSTYAGGIVGFNMGSIENCSTSDEVFVSAVTFNAGGIVGSNATGGIISKCANYSRVSFSGNNGFNGGGIAGGNNGTITQCYNMGTITVTNTYAGGIAGYSDKYSIINNCYNGGAISADIEFAGGIAGGLLPQVSDPNNKITNCYNYGAVTGPNSSAICGISEGMAYSNNHYDISTSIATEIATRGTGQSTATMTNGNFAATLNSGVSCWSEDVNNTNNNYPVLTHFETVNITSNSSTDFLAYSSHNTIVVKLNEPINGSISIFNINGALVAHSNISDITHSFAVATSGVYLVRISSSDGRMVKKVLVTK